ncbi:MAG: hypothetical protein LBI47_02710 [Puniceicoccales bacterium]|jgi:hypothetical protein|nr:hypothetical protein [Puniceicoccales bacterium]
MKYIAEFVAGILLLLTSACSSVDSSNAKSSQLPWARPTQWEQNPTLRLEDLSYSSGHKSGRKAK